MTRHTTRATTALRALNEVDPAMAALGLWCTHRDVDTGPTASTYGQEIRYGPAFDSVPRHEQIGLAAHHILHAALRHSARLDAMAARQLDHFDKATWNLAADAIVNEALVAVGYALPRPAVLLTDLLVTPSQTIPPDRLLAEWDVDRLYIHLMNGPDARQRTEGIIKSKSFIPDLSPQAAPDEGGHDAAEWRAHVTRAMETGRMAGRGMGLIGHRIADLPVPATPWETILRRLVSRAVTQTPQPTHRRPARNWIAADSLARETGTPTPAFQLGTTRQTDIPRIAVGLDTSSSIDEVRWSLFMGEIAGIARRTGAEIHLLPFDESVETAVRLDPGRWSTTLATLDTKRGGGTDFRPVIAAAKRLAPSIVILLTDLEGDPGPAPRLPVIWAVPDAARLPDAPFGQVISLAR
ncbi:MAG: VWA-like domain-containing protein [Rhodobacterales bacterium]|nr:VWA-like domain-containing protein [Rhodobacterales bacterium]